MDQTSYSVTDDGTHLHLTIQINIAGHHGGNLAHVMTSADVSTAQATGEGRRPPLIIPEPMGQPLYTCRTMEEGLRNVLTYDHELLVVYQPQHCIRTHMIVGAEALIRWRHPDQGLLSPAHFIPLAEDMGFITLLDEWVLYRVCQQHLQWQAAGTPHPARISLNLSARHFRDDRILWVMQNALEETGIDPACIELELTESAALYNQPMTMLLLKELARMGVRLALDDFGTGYSSLNYLAQFPVHTLKLDKSFVLPLPHDRTAATIVKATIDMAHTLGNTVVAEAVETLERMPSWKRRGVISCRGI
jgi:EAL domain-containing protein (putative c-di-GMP-specific phosphodiesterase class I)